MSTIIVSDENNTDEKNEEKLQALASTVEKMKQVREDFEKKNSAFMEKIENEPEIKDVDGEDEDIKEFEADLDKDLNSAMIDLATKEEKLVE